ncbi:MAG TPA: adenylate/guanylate cyclase domain-containing protein [Roseiarcus sp.]|jgi:class 3 adenylate cyclase/tetratricopeptide (TPR) repeat protein|nr:adenylate/guanylate cyclase domain-containing protein [Roseiarcus sp.]
MDVAGWLRGLGLARYEAVFHEAAIGPDVLPDLTDSDLEKLGVALGDRKRLLRAIGSLMPAETLAEPRVPPPAPLSGEDGAERRQLTVMFCDLVGSTTLTARLDPEDMREVIRAYQDACSGAVARYDGFVAKFMGDGVLAYFGFPRAHEEDAERAVRASLDIAAVVARLETRAKETLKVRIGIATGIVVVGDVVGQGTAQEQAVVGETPNLAARLQSLAEPGSAVIAESTRRLLGGAFELKPLGPQTLKGFDTPVSAWKVLREAANLNRFEASRSHGMLVGREHEVALLLDRWRDASEGEGQVALISGEAGIGKSRVLAALGEGIASEPHVRVRYQCSPHHVNDAFYPITSQIWHAAGVVSGEPEAARLQKLEAMIARSELDTKDIAPLLAALLTISSEARYRPLEMAPSELKERTIAALIALFEGLTKDATVLALLEDAHWIDPTSLDVFSRLIDRLPSLRALLVVTFRPEFAPPWVGHAHVASLSLSRFARRQVVAMVDRLTGGKALPAEVLEQIIAKTDGVPLFVEELTKTVIESGLLREEEGGYVLDRALSPLAIPSTLQDSLMERLDRLAPVKEIAQIGAVIGREFSYRLLEAVSPIQGRTLQDALDRLMAAELIHGRGTPPDATYVFKHALVQETAYASLLRSRRQHIHADIAQTLEEKLADQIETAPAVLAHHYTEGGIVEPAARSWLLAAKLALSRSAPVEAGRYVDAGLSLISHLPDGAERHSLELALQLIRVNALWSLKGYNAPEVVATLTKAQRLLDAGGGTDGQRISVLSGVWSANVVEAQLELALSLAREIVEISDRSTTGTFQVLGYRLLGVTQTYMGRNREALHSLQQAERYRDPNRQKLPGYQFGEDPILSILSARVLPLALLGLVEQAAKASDVLRAELPRHNHVPTVAFSMILGVVSLDAVLDDLEACERHSAELVAYCGEKKYEQHRLWGALFHACARAMRSPRDENISALRAAIDAYRRSGTRLFESLFCSYLAQALLIAGDVNGADATLQEAFVFVEKSGERFWLADWHRVGGQIALKQPEPDRAQAEARFLKAIEIARSQEARLLELRAGIDLARLWRETGSPNDRRALLEPILAQIEGGDTMRDVRSARALLAEIA